MGPVVHVKMEGRMGWGKAIKSRVKAERKKKKEQRRQHTPKQIKASRDTGRGNKGRDRKICRVNRKRKKEKEN